MNFYALALAIKAIKDHKQTRVQTSIIIANNDR